MTIDSVRTVNYGPPRRLLSDDEIFPLENINIPENTHETNEDSSSPDKKDKVSLEKSLIKIPDDTINQKPQLGPIYSRAELLAGKLTCEGDEYIDIEVDALGEQKVDRNGYLKGGRKYAGRTFQVIGHGERLFMLGTEVARITSYRDSYLLFLKNKTLRKVMASQEEKDDLIMKEIIPYSYRSRQIAIVTARSVFRRFGSRVIVSGKRWKDDYFEQMARDAGIPVEKYMEDSDRHRYVSLQPTSSSTVKNEEKNTDASLSKAPPPSLGSLYDTTIHPSSILDIAQHAKLAVEFNKQITVQRKERELYFHKHFYKQ